MSQCRIERSICYLPPFILYGLVNGSWVCPSRGQGYALMRLQVHHMTHNITDCRVIRISEAAWEGSRSTPSRESDPGRTQSPLTAREQCSLWNIELSGSNQPNQYCVNSSLAKISDQKLQSVTSGNRARSLDPHSFIPCVVLLHSSVRKFALIGVNQETQRQKSYHSEKCLSERQSEKKQLEQLWKERSYCGIAWR